MLSTSDRITFLRSTVPSRDSPELYLWVVRLWRGLWSWPHEAESWSKLISQPTSADQNGEEGMDGYSQVVEQISQVRERVWESESEHTCGRISLMVFFYHYCNFSCNSRITLTANMVSDKLHIGWSGLCGIQDDSCDSTSFKLRKEVKKSNFIASLQLSYLTVHKLSRSWGILTVQQYCLAPVTSCFRIIDKNSVSVYVVIPVGPLIDLDKWVTR